MARAYDIWPTLHEELDSPPFYTRVGQLLLTEREADPRLEARAWLQRQHGVETEVLSREAVRDMEPNVSNRVTGALYCPKDGVADHGATTRAYAAAAEKLGVQIQTGVRASTIATQGSRADGVITNEQERLPARKGVLVLANSAVAALTSPWLSLPLWNECLQVIVSRPLASVPFTHLTGHMSRTVSLKTEGADRVMVSCGWHGHWDLDTETGSTLHDAVAGNLAEAKEVYPDLAPIEAETADANHLESFCIDGIPIVDTVPGLDNLWFGAGWCGHGWAIAPVMSDLIAKWALTGTQPTDLQPFSLRRFGP